MERLVEVVQRRARERAQRFVGRTLEVLVEGPSRTDPSRLRGRSRHNKVVNFAGLGAPGELVEVRDHLGHQPDAHGRGLAARPRRPVTVQIPAKAKARRRSTPRLRRDGVCGTPCVRALEQPQPRDRRAHAPPGLPGGSRRAPFRCPRGDLDPVLRGPGEIGPQPRPGGVADAVSLDDQPVPRMHACLPILCLGRNSDPDGRRAHEGAGGAGPGDADLRHRAAREVPPLHGDDCSGPNGSRSSRPTASRSRTRPNSSLSGDHRFLTERGWKHVLNTVPGATDRPHLTMTSRLVGTGAFAPQPEHNRNYRRGYLCGMIRGDGHLASYEHAYRGQQRRSHAFRLALVDGEALRRTGEFLLREAIVTHERVFSHPSAGRREVRSVSSGQRRNRLAESPN